MVLAVLEPEGSQTPSARRWASVAVGGGGGADGRGCGSQTCRKPTSEAGALVNRSIKASSYCGI